MNVFDVRREIRKIGPNYGVPCYIVECGPGISYKNEALVHKLAELGLRKGNLISIIDGMGEIGLGTLVEGFKYLGVDVEVEAGGKDRAPGWFPMVSNWLVWWDGVKNFNFGALRRGLDVILYKGEDAEKFLKETSNINVGKAFVGKMEESRLFQLGVRIYE